MMRKLTPPYTNSKITYIGIIAIRKDGILSSDLQNPENKPYFMISYGLGLTGDFVPYSMSIITDGDEYIGAGRVNIEAIQDLKAVHNIDIDVDLLIGMNAVQLDDDRYETPSPEAIKQAIADYMNNMVSAT